MRNQQLSFAIVASGAIVLAVSSAFGQSGAAQVLLPWQTQTPHLEFNADWMTIDSGHTDLANSTFNLTRVDTAGRWMIAPDNPRRLALGFDATYLNVNSNDPALPQRLADLSIGASFRLYNLMEAVNNTGDAGKTSTKPSVGDWTFDINGGIGFAGDNPISFGDPHGTAAVYGIVNFIAQYGLSDKSNLILTLNYDGNRSIFPDVPLPLIAYQRRANENLSYVVGVPYSAIIWHPIDKMTVDVRYAPVSNIDLKVSYQCLKSLAVFAAMDSRLDCFHRQQAENDTRLFFEQRRVEGGVKWTPCRYFDVTVAGGYAFDQSFTSGFDVRNTTDVRDVSDEPYIRLGIEIRF